MNILDNEVVNVKPTMVGSEIYFLDVPEDSIIVKKLDEWRTSLDFEGAMLGSSSMVHNTRESDRVDWLFENDQTTHDYEILEDEQRMRALEMMSDDFLINKVIPDENKHPHRYGHGNTNFIDLLHFSDNHEDMQSTIRDYLNIEGFEFDHPTGAFWYPPTGYMSWHSNSEQKAYRMYAVWSPKEKGSFFKVQDRETKETITSWDKKGWTFRLFECVDKPIDKYSWHCIWSDSNRISAGFHYNKKP